MTPPHAAEKPARHPLLDAAERARERPVVWLSPEERGELDKRADDLASGRVEGVPHEDVPAWLEAHARELGELAE